MFDTERKRRCFESLFTPRGLLKAFQSAKHASHQIEEGSVLDPFEEDVDQKQLDSPLSSTCDQELREPVFSTSGTSNWGGSKKHTLRSLSSQDKETHDNTDLRIIVHGLMDKGKEYEQAINAQAQAMEDMETRTSTLEAGLQETLATMRRLESETSIEQSKWQGQVQSSLLELESQLNNRLASAFSNKAVPSESAFSSKAVLSERSISNIGMPSREGTNRSNPCVEPRMLIEQEAAIAELSDRLALIDADLRQQILAAKQSLQKALEPLEAKIREQRTLCQVLKDELYEEVSCRESCDSRVASLEATLALQVAGETPSFHFEDAPSSSTSAAARSGSATPVSHGLPHRHKASGSPSVREGGSGQSHMSRGSGQSHMSQNDGLPEQHRSALHRKNRYHDGFSNPRKSRMCS